VEHGDGTFPRSDGSLRKYHPLAELFAPFRGIAAMLAGDSRSAYIHGR